jgi:hypothetical protein
VSVVANVAINLDARQAKANSDALRQKVGHLNRSLENTGKSAASATANVQRFGIAFRSVIGPIVGVVGAVNLLSRSLKVLGERQADAVVLANGLAKVGATRADLIKLQQVADKLGKQTLFNQEDFDRGFALLTSFQSIGVSSYERVAKAAADVAQVTKQDVNSSLLQLAKALQDPEKGLTALARSGTQFTESQQDLIKSLVASGKQLEAQDFILKEIEKQYGNAATAAGSAGYAGAVDSLQESFRDFQERLAKGVEPAVNGTLKALTDLLDVANKIPEPVGRAAIALGATTAALVALRAAALSALPALKALLVFVVANPWIALAAGITAATIALAGYRSEAQKLAGSAATGDPVAIAGARNRLSQVGQDISLLQQRRQSATGQQRQALNRQIQNLRRTEAELRSGITTGTAALTPGPTPAIDVEGAIGGGGAGGKSGADKAARDAERAAEQMKQQLKAADDINFALKNRLAITQETESVAKRMIEFDVRQNEIAKEYDELKKAAKSADELAIINANQIIEQRIAQIEYEQEINDLLAQRAILMADILRQAAMPTVYNELETQEAALQAVLDKYPAIGEAADAAATLATSGMAAMIDGTKSAQEVFADFLNSIANALMQTAAKMIAQYIAIGIARMFAGIGAPGGFAPSGPLAAVGDVGTGFNFDVGAMIPGRAKGGPVSSGQTYMVGERGPELFVPSRSGTIVANDKMGGSNVNVVVNVDAKGSSVEGNEQSANQLGRVISAAVQSELIKQQRPGGILAR